MKQSFIIREISLTLVLISFWFIAERFWIHIDWLSSEILHQHTIITISICAIVYGTSEFLLSLAWRRLLMWCGHKDISRNLCHTIYGKSQIAKYIPGNVFHFAGRHLLGSQAGISHRILTSVAIYEILGLLTISSAIGFSGIVVFGIENTYLSKSQITSIIFAGLLLSVLIAIIAPYFLKARDVTLPQQNIWRSIHILCSIQLLYLIFFLTAGLLLVFIIETFVNIDLIIAIKIIAVFSIAWIAGFIVPGAPGGLGIREVVIVYSMAPIIGEAQAVAAAIALRLATLFGDIWFFTACDKRFLKLFSRK